MCKRWHRSIVDVQLELFWIKTKSLETWSKAKEAKNESHLLEDHKQDLRLTIVTWPQVKDEISYGGGCKVDLFCLSGQEMAPTRQRPLWKNTLGASNEDNVGGASCKSSNCLCNAWRANDPSYHGCILWNDLLYLDKLFKNFNN